MAHVYEVIQDGVTRTERIPELEIAEWPDDIVAAYMTGQRGDTEADERFHEWYRAQMQISVESMFGPDARLGRNVA